MPELHRLVSGFADADVYERGRSGYGPAVVDAIASGLELAPGARVADLGAGTGKLSRALLATGFDAVGVEPLAGMRGRLAEVVGPERALDGTAESIPLADASVEAVTAADSFHWFREREAIEEIRRVLTPGGGVAVIWGVPAWRDDKPPAWATELGSLIDATRPEQHPGFSGRRAAAPFAEAGGFTPVEMVEAVTETPADRATLIAQVASISWIGKLDQQRRTAVLAEVERMLERHGVDHYVRVVRAQIHLSRLLPA